MDDVRIVAVDVLADDGLLDQWLDAAVASARHEFGERHTTSSADEVRARQRLTTDEAIVHVVALHSDEVVGQGEVRLPLADNRHIASLSFAVRPECRRRGVGSLLLHHLEQLATADDRTTLCVESEVAAGHPDPARGFAAVHGYAAALVNLRNDLDLPPDLGALLEPLEADAPAHSGGYDVLTWWDDVPEQWLDQRAHLASRMSTDAPMGELLTEEEQWDADRVREQLSVIRAQGRRLVETVAVERATGRLVAFTDLAVAAHTPDLAYQWDTLVLKEHRGRRLGQLVKAANLRALLRELPDVRRVVTWNAEVNASMLAVNRAMGFVTVGRITEWQKIVG